MSEEVTISIGGMWEFKEWKISKNYLIEYENNTDSVCPHCFDIQEKYINNLRRYSWKCPRVIIVENESGCNSTGLCIDCVLDNKEVLL